MLRSREDGIETIWILGEYKIYTQLNLFLMKYILYEEFKRIPENIETNWKTLKLRIITKDIIFEMVVNPPLSTPEVP